MAFHFLFVFALLNIVFAGSLGAEHEEAYWKSVFPNNNMPKALKQILPTPATMKDCTDSDSFNEPNAPTNLGENDGWKVQLSNSINRAPRFYVDDWTVHSKGNHENHGWKVQVSHPSLLQFYNRDWTVDSKGNHENVEETIKESKDKEFDAPTNIQKNDGWKVQLSDSTPHEPRFYVDDWTVDSKANHEHREESLKVRTSNSDDFSKDSPTAKPSNNNHGNYKDSTKGSYVHSIQDYLLQGNKDVSEVHNNGGLIKSIFFLQKDLRRGMLVNHTSLITSDKTPFLSDRIVKSIPFSSNKLPQILNHFSLKLGSKEAEAVKDTIRGCERVTMKGEEKFCATSFESLIDLSVSKLGKQIQLLSNELSRETRDPLFTIGRGIQNMGENEIVCHKMDYPGAVFLCHSIDKTIVYKVPLVGRDGTKANALAVCHKDTSAWNPKHMAFRVLKVKPGTVPICHFLVRDTLVWVSN